MMLIKAAIKSLSRQLAYKWFIIIVTRPSVIICDSSFLNLHQIGHNDVIKWKHFPRHWPFVLGIHRSPVNSPHKGQWRGALMFSLICASVSGWVNNREGGDLRRHHGHYGVNVMRNSMESNAKPTSICVESDNVPICIIFKGIRPSHQKIEGIGPGRLEKIPSPKSIPEGWGTTQISVDRDESRF